MINIFCFLPNECKGPIFCFAFKTGLHMSPLQALALYYLHDKQNVRLINYNILRIHNILLSLLEKLLQDKVLFPSTSPWLPTSASSSSSPSSSSFTP